MPPEFPELSEDGGAIQLEVENFVEPVVVVRLNEKDLIALSPVCTHLGCTVRKEPSFFRCPCHGSTYALDGTVVRGPAKQRLTVFRTERVDNRLLIYL
jgi:cytochrome b6-f complex iron-sulfur subunit